VHARLLLVDGVSSQDLGELLELAAEGYLKAILKVVDWIVVVIDVAAQLQDLLLDYLFGLCLRLCVGLRALEFNLE